MYEVICMENGTLIDYLETEDIGEIERFFNKNRYFANLNNNMIVIANMEESEYLKFHKNKDRNKYIKVTR